MLWYLKHSVQLRVTSKLVMFLNLREDFFVLIFQIKVGYRLGKGQTTIK